MTLRRRWFSTARRCLASTTCSHRPRRPSGKRLVGPFPTSLLETSNRYRHELLLGHKIWYFNINANNQAEILTEKCLFQAVIDANIFPVLIDILSKAEFKTRKEAAWAITNATSGGSTEQIFYLSSQVRFSTSIFFLTWLWRFFCTFQNCIPPLCDLLTVQDAKIVQVALNGLENILRMGEQDCKGNAVNYYAVLIEECYGRLTGVRAMLRSLWGKSNDTRIFKKLIAWSEYSNGKSGNSPFIKSLKKKFLHFVCFLIEVFKRERLKKCYFFKILLKLFYSQVTKFQLLRVAAEVPPSVFVFE